MKYATIIPRNIEKLGDIKRNKFISEKNFFDKETDTIVITIAKIKTFPKDSGNLLFRCLLSLLTNIKSLVYCTLFNLYTKYGTDITVHQNIIPPSRIFPKILVSPAISTKRNPKLIPNQKIRFQKLSRFSLDLTQFILLICLLPNYYVIITGFRYLMQIKTAIYSWNFAFYYWLAT